MAAHLADFFRLVLEASWQSSLVIVLILLVRPLMGSRIPASWRHLLWALVLIRLLVPVSFFPPSPVSMQNMAVVDRPLEQAGFVPPSEGERVSYVIQQGPVTGESSVALTTPAPAKLSAITLWSLASGIWLAGTFLFLGVMVCAQVAIYRRIGKATAPVDPVVLAAWDKCCAQLKMTRRPLLRVSGDVTSPALVGLFRPVLLLPEQTTADFLPEDWENVFVHELAHYRRADHWIHALQLAALSVHWFNPMVWIGFRQLRADRELAADEWALRHLGAESSEAYGGTLLKVLEQSSDVRLSMATVGILEDRVQLKQRLQRIMAFGPRTLIGSLVGFAIVVVVALLVLGRSVANADLGYYKDYKPDEALIKAAQMGDIQVMRKMLHDGADINAIGGYYQQTPLSIAAVADQRDALQFLLSKGADINRKADKGLSAVEDAMANGRGACADILLDHGASCPPLELAAYTGDMATVQAELAKPSLDYDQAKAAVRIAACNGRVEPFKAILAKVRTHPGDAEWRMQDRDVLTIIARGQRETFLAFLNAPPSWDRGGHGGVVRIGYAASQTPGMRDWLVSQGFTVPEYIDGERLIDAAEHEDLPEMDRLLKKGVKVEYLGESSWTPITKAATWNRVHSVKFLLEHGADPNSHHYSYTGICLTSKPAVADLLYAAGAKIDTGTMSYNLTFGQAEMVKWFLDHGVKPHLGGGNDFDSTSLFQAGSPEVAELLIQHGVDVKATNKEGMTALHRICMFGEKPAETAEVLLKHGANPNARTSQGMTPLMYAKDGPTVDVLIKYGADINAKNNQGAGVMEMIGNQADPSRIDALIKHGAPFNPMSDGPALLVGAAWTGKLSMISALLDRGVDPNIKGAWNKRANVYMTPLVAAVADGQIGAAKLLVERGATINDDAMQDALANGRAAIVKLFWEHGNRSIPELTYQISQGAPVADIQKLLDNGASVEPPDDKTMSPVALAAQLGQADVVKLLVERGAKIEGKASPLGSATGEGQDEVVAYLIQHGSKPEYQDLWNATWNSHPYESQRSHDHFEKTMQLLVDAGGLKGLTENQSADLLSSSIFTRYPGGNPIVLKMLLDGGLSLKAKNKEGKSVLDQLQASGLQEGMFTPEMKDMIASIQKANPPKAAK